MEEKAEQQNPVQSVETYKAREVSHSLEHSKAVDSTLSALMSEFPVGLNP
jgi:hypothetical protein